MQTLIPVAEKIAEILKRRRETIAIAESSSGGLISAAMLAVPGASAYFLGGGVVYTLKARRALLNLSDDAFAGMRGLSEDVAKLFARAARDQLGATWGISEIGASGPTGSRYGDPAGTSCIAIVGAAERAIKLHTGSADRVGNMMLFAARALDLFAEALAAAPEPRA